MLCRRLWRDALIDWDLEGDTEGRRMWLEEVLILGCVIA